MKSTAQRLTLALLLASTLCTSRAHSQSDGRSQSAGMEFFEKKIRSVLVEKCYSCHSAEAKSVKGGFRLDTLDAIRKGGDSGAAVVPGKVSESLLIKAIEHSPDFYEMPPNGKLSARVIADFRRWIEMGAPDPRAPDAGNSSSIVRRSENSAAATWWSFQPRSRPRLPEVANATWSLSGIDPFVLERLEGAQLTPARDASRELLVRRLWLDLVGLPVPTEEADAFIQCSDEDFDEFYQRQVDRLLVSPQFGERWGRHWLDVFRFAESSGGGRTLLFRDAWRFRDYVVDAINEDLSMRDMIQQQIAGDLLPSDSTADRRRKIVATGLLALGPTNYERQDKDVLEYDVIDEQMDVLGRAYLGMTIGCARCHDHKFDPIPTRDYYAVAGILRSSLTLIHENVSKWVDTPLPVEPSMQRLLDAHESKIAALNTRIQSLKQVAKVSTATSTTTGSNIMVANQLPGIVVDDLQAKAVGQWKQSTFHKRFVGDGYLHDEDRDKGKKTLTFVPKLPSSGRYEVRFAYQEGVNRAKNARVTVFHADGELQVVINQQEAPTIDGRFVSLGEFRFESTGQGFVLVSNEGSDGHVIADAVQFLPVTSAAEKGMGNQDAHKVASKPGSNDDSAAINELKRLEKEVKQLTQAGPKRELAMSIQEHDRIEDCAILIRGNTATKGPTVPRGVLSFNSGGPPVVVPSRESGRRQLAEWLTRDSLSLPPRVIANRIWHWLMGVGIVRTTDNFGSTGEVPSHPALLEFLAEKFVEQNWSVKQLVREVVLSRTYRMSSDASGPGLKVDPANRLLWRAHRRRIDVEVLRDSMLVASGTLDGMYGGSTIEPEVTIEYEYVFTGTRRSVYTPVFRNKLLRIFEALDFADPNQSVGARNDSTTSTQALYFMNDPFAITQSRIAADRLLGEFVANDEQRIIEAYRRTLGRFPTQKEVEIVQEHLLDASPNDLLGRQQLWAMVFQSLFSSAEFRYLK